MPNFRSVDRNLKFIAVDFDAQILPGTFEHAVSVLVDQELDLTPFIETYRNDATGAPAYHPSILLKVILFGYSRGLISLHAISAACRKHVQFIALSGGSQPDSSTLADFVSRHTEAIQSLFTQVLVICNREGLISREMFAIDWVKLPSNAAKSRSGLREDSAREAQKLEKPKQFPPSAFKFSDDLSICICPAGKRLYRSGNDCNRNGLRSIGFKGPQIACGNCKLRSQCLHQPDKAPVRQVGLFLGKHESAPEHPIERMRRKLDTEQGRRMITPRFATVGPVFANPRHNKGLDRFTLRSRKNVEGQWRLYCLVRDIEKQMKARLVRRGAVWRQLMRHARGWSHKSTATDIKVTENAVDV